MIKNFIFFLLIISKVIYSSLYGQFIPGSFEFEGRIRNYEVHLPQNFQSDFPLVIVLHGYTEDIASIKALTEMHLVTDTSQMLTVYPKSWGIS